MKTGVLIVSTAAGALFLPRLMQIAKGNLAFSVGLMVLVLGLVDLSALLITAVWLGR
jgi:hypothetical protein